MQDRSSEYNEEHAKWLQKRWDGGEKMYYWKEYDATTGDWVFYQWLSRPDSGVFTGVQTTQSTNIDAVVSPGEVVSSSPGQVTSSQQNQSRLPRGEGHNITGHGDSHYERIDPSYFVRPKSFFREGRVFSIIMNETTGSTTAVTDYNTSRSMNRVKFEDNWVYTNVRRFIVVRQKRESCFACPIFTYSGKVTTKRGVHAKEHAVAYTWGYSPQILEGETGIEKAAICVVMTDNNPALDPASRIYFGIHHPIQYNVKVKEIGYVHPDYVAPLIGNWKQENGTEQAPEVTAGGHRERQKHVQELEESNYSHRYRRY